LTAEDNRATRAIIHLDHLIHNLECIRRLAGEGRKICIAVKADAYGHGAVEISKKALEWGVDFLAVATVHEGILLRKAGITAPVLLFGFALKEEIPQLVEWSLSPFAGSREYILKLNEEAARRDHTVQVHLKIDTGMGRIGAAPEDAVALASLISGCSHLNLQGVCTHLPVSDGTSDEDLDFTEDQISLFSETVDGIRAAGIDPGIVHAANSGGIIAHRKSHFDMVRPGICLYGYYPDPDMERTEEFKPVMEMVSRINFIKKVSKGTTVSYGRTWTAPEDTWIGTIPVGYADGYNRLLSSKGQVQINGTLYTVAGRVCMDQFMVDLGAECRVSLYDEAVLFGPRKGAWTAADLAAAAGTIPYEITCNINKRVPREYQN